MDIRNLNLYNVSLNKKQDKKPADEEKTVKENSEKFQPKAPEAKPVTASMADVVAEMNKYLVVNSESKGSGIEENVVKSGDEQFAKYCELIQKLNSLRPGTREYIDTVEALLELAEAFAQNNITSVDADWVAAANHWREIFEGLGRDGRGANGGRNLDRAAFNEDSVVEQRGANMFDGAVGNVTMEELMDASSQIWNRVQELLDEFNMDYDVSIFGNIFDGESNFENNLPYQNILYELGQQLSDQELIDLQILVLKFEKMLSDYHAINPNYPLDKLKHSVFHGIAPFILAPNGLY